MFGNGLKTIGVILCDVSSHYQEQICHTITSYVQSAGYNVAYFTFYTCYGTQTRNGRGEANIIHLVPYEDLDAIIFCHDTLTNQEARDKTWEYIKSRCTCPVITLRRDSGEYPCVLVNQKHSIEQIVYHFIDDHKLKRVAFLSGPYDHPDSIKRLNDYKDALANRGISFDEKLVFEGDFWHERTKEAAKYFMMDLEERPEAIVCANDYMAIDLSNELISQGFLVPDDIAISGFDDIWEASITMPPITTIAVPVAEMSRQALKLIEKMWNGEEIERVNYLDAEIKIRNSCGCETFSMQSMLAKRVRQVNEHNHILERVQINTYISIDLSDMDTVDGIEDKTRLLEYADNHVRSFFICLGEGRGSTYPKYRSSKTGFAKKSKAIGGGVLDGKKIDTKSFETRRLLPPEATVEEPMVYYFFPLHNNQYSFGYFAISFEDVYSVDKAFQNWLAILGNALDMIRIKQKNHRLLRELNELYVHDALTGLYNRRGFDSASKELYDRAREEKKTFVVFALDMDNLKIVNDRFGHMNGDLALKTIGAAMEAAAQPGDVCARVGGDEYNVVGIGYDKDKAVAFIDAFQQYLDDFNETSELPYLVRASVGWHMILPGEKERLEACVNKADASLYEYKRKKKEKKKDGVIREKESE